MPLVALGAQLGWARAQLATWQQGGLRAAGIRLDTSEGCFRSIALDENWASQVALEANNLLANAGDIEMLVQSLDQEDPLEQGVATLSSVLDWKIPWTEEPGGLQSVGLKRIRHDWVTKQQTEDHGPHAL